METLIGALVMAAFVGFIIIYNKLTKNTSNSDHETYIEYQLYEDDDE